VLKRPTYTAAELAERGDALALRVGTRATASALLVACLVVIVIGAQSLLTTLEGMDRDIKEMNEQLAVANGGVDVLNKIMESLGPTSRHLDGIVSTVKVTDAGVASSATAIGTLATKTGDLDTKLGSIKSTTTDMRGSLESTATSTKELGGTISTLNTKIGPLVETQGQMLERTRTMRDRVDDMNGSLAYVVRILNYMTAPPTMQPFAVRMSLPPLSPAIPGVRIEARPVSVFDRNAWPIYQGP
jgi:methyl-accepting chemotaxis protein